MASKSLLKRIPALVSGFLFFVCLPAAPQQRDASLRILDRTTGQAIEGTSFRFGTEQGVSDASGEIRFHFMPGHTLFLYHLGYGDWSLQGAALTSALEEGIVFKDRQALSLQPITVLALRSETVKIQEIGISAQARLSHDVGAVLNQTAAVSSIRKSGSYGFDPVLRGFKYEQLNLVLDGVQFAVAACPNRMDPPTSQVAPNMLSEIEILKGPHSFRYGTSFGGTIHFRSTPHRFSPEREIYGRFSSGVESNEGIYRTEVLAGGSGPGYDLAVLGSWSRGDDYRDGSSLSVPSSFSRASVGTVLGVRLSERQDVTVSVTRNEARDTDFPALPMDLRHDRTWLVRGRHELRVSGPRLRSWSSTLYGTSVDHLMDNRARSLDPRTVNATTAAETGSFGGRTEGVWRVGGGELFSGLNLRMEEADGTRTREFLAGPKAGETVRDNVWNGGRVVRGGLFGEYHRDVGPLRLVASGRIEINRITAGDLDDGFHRANPDVHRTQLNPSLSIGGRRQFGNGRAVGLWFGRAQRSGSLVERYINSFPVGLDPFEMLGNPGLEPEVNHQVDLTFDLQTEGSTLDMALFASFLEDYISAEIDPALSARMPSAPGVKRYVNIRNAFLGGLELVWSLRLPHGLRQTVDLAFTYGQDRVRDKPLPEIAPLDVRYILSGSLLEDRLHPTVVFRHVVEQDRTSEAFGETPSPSFSVVDLGLVYRLSPGLGLRAGVNNLFDESYYEHLSRSVRGQSSPIRSPGRNLYLGFSLDRM